MQPDAGRTLGASGRRRRLLWLGTAVVPCCVASWAGGQCVSVWESAATNTPGARQQAAVAYDSMRERVVMFGGFDLQGRKGDTWAFDGSQWTLLTTAGPSARAGHAMAYDGARDRVVLFGGFVGASMGDTWEFDGTTWTLRSESGPAARSEHAMAFDAARSRTVMLGGEADGEQTWEWDGSGWSAAGVAGPPSRIGHAMVFDSSRSRIVMTLGRGPTGLRNGTWVYDGVEWRQISASGPSPRFYHAMLYDAARDRVVLFGGTSTGAGGLSDTWEFDGTLWSERTTSSTPPRLGAVGTFETARGAGLVFGGSTTAGIATGETWRWQVASAPVITGQPAGLEVAEGATAVFEVTASGSSPLVYQWSFDGATLNDGATAAGDVVGSRTPHLEVRGVTGLGQGVYQCAVMNGCGVASSAAAVLVVHARCPADVDDGSGSGTPDGGVTVDDLLFYFSVFGNGDIRADVDDGSGTGMPDGGVTVDDMLYFLVRYNGGC